MATKTKIVKTTSALKKAMKKEGVKLPHGYEVKKRVKKKRG